MPDYTKVIDKARDITFIVESPRDFTDSEIDSFIAFHIKDQGQPKNGSINFVKVLTPKARMPQGQETKPDLD